MALSRGGRVDHLVFTMLKSNGEIRPSHMFIGFIGKGSTMNCRSSILGVKSMLVTYNIKYSSIVGLEILNLSKVKVRMNLVIRFVQQPAHGQRLTGIFGCRSLWNYMLWYFIGIQITYMVGGVYLCPVKSLSLNTKYDHGHHKDTWHSYLISHWYHKCMFNIKVLMVIGVIGNGLLSKY